jgi:DNA gyrase subunit B
MNKNYDANAIEVLDGLEAIRKRPDMYVGATTGKYSPALFRILREIIDNSLDEYLGGFNNSLYIFYDTKTNVCTVIDNGRGIPTGMNEKIGMNALTAVFTKVHSGGKFDHDVYKTSSGKNGVGITALNALSEWMIAYSNNNRAKSWMCQKFKRGIEEGKVISAGLPSEFKSCIKKTGTIVQFKPDYQIFKDGIEMDIQRLKRELNDIQYLCPKLNIQLHVDGQVTSYYSETGLTELVCDGKQYEHVFSYTAENIDAAIAFTKKDGSSFKSYVNIVYTDMGGTHLAGFKKIICDIVKENSKKPIANEDILEGMVGAIHYKMAEPQYQSQTKNELTSAEAKDDVMKLLEQPLRAFFKKNKSLLERIVKYAEEMYAKKEKMKADKDLLKGLKNINNAAKYISEKFSDADRRKYRNVDDLEMFVVEGDSAGGHFKQAREGFQACLKLRGKIINAAKATQTQLFGSTKKGSEQDGNREIKDLTAALGCGVLDQYDESKLRFSKLIIMCFTGDTKVKLLNGTEKTFEELVEYEKEHPDSEYWVYSVDENGSFVPGKAMHPRITGYVNELIEITLDNGSSFKCTPDHLLMLRDGSYREAKDVTPEDSLMPLYTDINRTDYNRNREIFYDNSTGKWEFTHLRVSESLNERPKIRERRHVHHIDKNYRNNDPRNLEILSPEEHYRIHRDDRSELMIRYNKSDIHKERISYLWKNTDRYDKAKFGNNGYNGSEKHKEDLRRAFADGRLTADPIKEWNLTPEARKLHSELIGKSNSDEKINQVRVHNRLLNLGVILSLSGIEITEELIRDKYAIRNMTGYKIRLKTIKKNFGTLENYISEVENAILEGCTEISGRIASLIKNKDVTLKNRKDANFYTKKNSIAKIGKAVLERNLSLDKKHYMEVRSELGSIRVPKYENILNYFDSYADFEEYSNQYNHKILSKRTIKLDKMVPVYDFTVEQYHNFVLGGGCDIVTHQCDSDSDGSHIVNLILSFLIKYMPDLIKNGHVYTIDAPLFVANGANCRAYGNTRNEVEKKMKEAKCKQYTITRMKGWGECNADDLATLCISPKTRKLIQMKYDDKTLETLEQTMAGDSEFRKVLLEVK